MEARFNQSMLWHAYKWGDKEDEGGSRLVSDLGAPVLDGALFDRELSRTQFASENPYAPPTGGSYAALQRAVDEAAA